MFYFQFLFNFILGCSQDSYKKYVYSLYFTFDNVCMNCNLCLTEYNILFFCCSFL